MTATGLHVVAPPRCGGSDTASPTYHGVLAGRLHSLRPRVGAPDDGARRAHDEFRDLVLDPTYTCVAARSAFKRGDYRFGRYARFGTTRAADSLAVDLAEFVSEFPIRAERFATFVASFDGPGDTSEQQFEDLLWTQLEHLCALDEHDWDPAVHDNPRRRGFSFSFAGRAFFIVGMHAGSSRIARRVSSPTLVFNAHAQFDELRVSGRMPRMQEINRTRDVRLQGSTNPSLARFDWDSETVMYSGRLVEPEWACPMHTRAETDGGAS